MTLALHYALRSDVGLLREGNEDSAYAGPNLLALADGMGGYAAGEVASSVAIAALLPLDVERPPGGYMLDALASAVTSANRTLREMSLADPATEGMGTTLTAMLWSGATIALVHIGDSRAYLLRGGEFEQITQDHTLVQSLVDDGLLSRQAAATHPQRSLVTRALQTSTEADPDLWIREAQLGDRYLLCSDGLSDVVSEETLGATLTGAASPEEAVGQLIELAIRGGGPDNITCIVADVVDTVTGPVAPSHASVLAGAAANGDGKPRLRTDSPAGRAHVLTTQENRDAGPAAPPAADGADGYHDDDHFDHDEADTGRRRWPLVTSILVILILLIAGGAYTTWHISQGQYFVASDGSQVVIKRGVDEKVAGLTLSSTYLRTGIPLSHVQASVIELPTSSSSLAEAQRTVQNIRRTYQCKMATAAAAKWETDKPKAPVVAKNHKPTRQQKLQLAKVKAYPPKPAVPAFCASLGSG